MITAATQRGAPAPARSRPQPERTSERTPHVSIPVSEDDLIRHAVQRLSRKRGDRVLREVQCFVQAGVFTGVKDFVLTEEFPEHS